MPCPFRLTLSCVVVSLHAVVRQTPHAALLETYVRSRKGKGHSGPAFQTALCRHARRGKPLLTLVSDGKPLRRLLLGS